MQHLVERGREHDRAPHQRDQGRSHQAARQVFAGRLDDIEARVEEMRRQPRLPRGADEEEGPPTKQAAGRRVSPRSTTRKAPAKQGGGEEGPGQEGRSQEVTAKKAAAKKCRQVPPRRQREEEGGGEEGARKAVVRGAAAAAGRRHGAPRPGRSAAPRRHGRSRPNSVLVNGAVADKSSRLVDPADAVVVQRHAARFVSRGGEKLDAALDAFAIDVAGLRVLDAGASTGGFTDCLLQRGAAHVVALDVGHGQLHPRIRDDPRVTVLERFHVARRHRGRHRRSRRPRRRRPVVHLARSRAAAAARRVPSGGTLVLLVKPQFEAGRAEVDRGSGVIPDPADPSNACATRCRRRLVDHGCEVVGWIDSPITGAQGNREFLVHARARSVRICTMTRRAAGGPPRPDRGCRAGPARRRRGWPTTVTRRG